MGVRCCSHDRISIRLANQAKPRHKCSKSPVFEGDFEIHSDEPCMFPQQHLHARSLMLFERFQNRMMLSLPNAKDVP